MNNIVFNAILNLDPTRTTVLRNKFAAEMYKRFRWLKGLIRKSVVDNDCFGYHLQTSQGQGYTSIIFNQATPTNAFAFERDPKKVQLFQKWLQEQTDKGILEIIPGTQIGDAVEDAWTNQYIQTSYQKGIARGRQELINANYAVPALGDSGGMNAVFNSPFHLDRVGLVYTRAFTGLKKITDEMSGQISSVLAEGMSQGLNPLEIAKNLNNRVDKIGITRARTLARTEIIRSHHYATIQEYENWGAEGVEVMAEWATAGYRVCGRCASIEGAVYTLKEIREMIPLHPNCRCCAIPKKVEAPKKSTAPKPRDTGFVKLENKQDMLKSIEHVKGSQSGNYLYRAVEKASDKNPTIFVNDSKGELLSAANLIVESDNVLIDVVGSLGRGGGQNVIKAVSKYSDDIGKKGVIDLTPLGNVDAIDFYIKTGFDMHPEIPNKYRLTNTMAKEMNYIE